ncbi:MAG: phospholipase [Thermodesulfobacteriota bacterium]|jgi:hypothetical protein
MFIKNHLKILGMMVYFLTMLPPSSYAWNNHVYLTYSALKGQPDYQVKVAAEPLESFLSKEKNKIGDLLKSEETWAISNVKAYPAVPQSLNFINSKETNLRLRFLKAMRLNPGMKIPLFVMVLPGSPASHKKPLPWSAISVLANDFQNMIYIPLAPGEKISALDVLSSASDEPDNGLDIGLWENNDTSFGKEYGYGKQPFGNPKLSYGTQAPFHMGFYHESKIIYKADPSFQKTFTEQRVHLYRSLARLAFQTGHPYWGYRFAGWGLHYLQDMTMPYHTTMTPGRRTVTMLSLAILDLIGIHGPKSSAVSEVSRAHILIEKLLNEELRDAFLKHDEGYVLFKTLADTSIDTTYPAYFDHFPSRVAAKESHAAAKVLSSVLKAIITVRKLYTDIEKISEEGDYDAHKIIANAPEKDVRKYNRIIEKQIRSVGAFTRIYLRSLK